MKGPVKDKLKRFGLFSRLGEQRFFVTLGEAVNRYLESQSVEWVDWEDRDDNRSQLLGHLADGHVIPLGNQPLQLAKGREADR